jgi:hypothetical protein
MLEDAGYHTALSGVHHERACPGGALLPRDPQPWQEVVRSGRAARTGKFYAQIDSIETHEPYERFVHAPDRFKGVSVPTCLIDSDAARGALRGCKARSAR